MSHDDFEESIEALFALQGLNARVFVDSAMKEVSIAYDDILPDDLAPMLILDANGLQRKTYEYWQMHRKGIKFLPSREKSYKGFTVHHWNRGAGNDAYAEENYRDLAAGVAKTIDSDVPKDEKVLVVHRLPNHFRVDMKDKILGLLKSDPKRVSFTTWGQHTATNDFVDHKHVILVGTLNLPDAATEALGLSSKKQDVGVALSKEEFYEIRRGELASDILQAACRGSVRKVHGDTCPPGCHLYIIHSNKSAIDGESLFQRVFPGSSYEIWEPIIAPPSGKLQKAFVGAMLDLDRQPTGATIQIKSLLEKCEIQNRRDLIVIADAVGPYLEAEYGIGPIIDADTGKVGLKQFKPW